MEEAKSLLEKKLYERADKKLHDHVKEKVQVPTSVYSNGATLERIRVTAKLDNKDVVVLISLTEIKNCLQRELIEHLRKEWREKEITEHLRQVDNLQIQLDNLQEGLNH